MGFVTTKSTIRKNMTIFSELASKKLIASGLPQAELLSSKSDFFNFQDSEAKFLLGPIVIKLIKDRGEEFLELGFRSNPSNTFQFCDIEIAMGWSTIAEVLEKDKPENIETVLARLSIHYKKLSSLFSDEFESSTMARIDRASKDRGIEFVNRLRARSTQGT
jgi:hypothetical protein